MLEKQENAWYQHFYKTLKDCKISCYFFFSFSFQTPPSQGRMTPGSHTGVGGGSLSQTVNMAAQSPSATIQSQMTALPFPSSPVHHVETPSSSMLSSPHVTQGSLQNSQAPALPPVAGRSQVAGISLGSSTNVNPIAAQIGHLQRHQLPQGHPGLQGPSGRFPGQPRPIGFPGHLRHIRPDMVTQIQHLQGFPHFDPLQAHAMQRPPVSPHWMAPGTTSANNLPARRSPRPAGPGINTLVRMGIPRTRYPGPEHNQPIQHPPHSQGIHSSHTHESSPSSGQTHVSNPEAMPESVVVPTSGMNTAPSPMTNKEKSERASDELENTTKALKIKGMDHLENEGTVSQMLESSIEEKGSASNEGLEEKIPGKKGFQASPGGPSSMGFEEERISSQSNLPQTAEESKSADGIESKSVNPSGEHKDGTPPSGECTDGIHCGTPPPGECTDGIHCGTPPPGECKDGIHCGTPPPGKCTDGIHCGTPPQDKCTDGIHCGTPPPGECTDGIHCGTPPPGECTDGIHCGTPPPEECTDGIHCGTPPLGECSDGIHCGTPPAGECTDGIHCGTPPPGECTDGIHCGTPPPEECTDGIHCGTPPPRECADGINCETPPPGEFTDGIHCGTPRPGECTDGIHCGTPPPGECKDGIHCGTPPPGECTDGIHCGTPPPGESTDEVQFGTPIPGVCTDGIHCGTPPPGECKDGLHCGTPPPEECADGIHCGTPPPVECKDGLQCRTPPPNECTDGLHCGTPPPDGESSDGKKSGTPPLHANGNDKKAAGSVGGNSESPNPPAVGQAENVKVVLGEGHTENTTLPQFLDKKSSPSLKTDDMDPEKVQNPQLRNQRPDGNNSPECRSSKLTEPNLLSPQQLAIHADHQYVNIAQISSNVIQKPQLSEKDAAVSDNAAELSSITPSNVTITPSVQSAFSLPVDKKKDPPIKELKTSEDVGSKPFPYTMSSSADTNTGNSMESDTVVPLTTSTSVVPSPQGISAKPSSIPEESKAENLGDNAGYRPLTLQESTKSAEYKIKPKAEMGNQDQADDSIKLTIIKQEPEKQIQTPESGISSTVSQSNIPNASFGDMIEAEDRRQLPTSAIGISSESSAVTSVSHSNSSVQVQLTEIPKPQHFGPIQRYPLQHLTQGEQRRFPQPSRQAVPQSYAQVNTGFPRMDMRGHPPSTFGQIGIPRQSIQQQGPGSLEQSIAEGQRRIANLDSRQWPPGFDPRIRPQALNQRMMTPDERSKSDSVLGPEQSQRYTLHDPEYNNTHGRVFPGQGTQLRLSSSVTSSSQLHMQESRYQLQHQAPDPRYTLTGQQDLRPQMSRIPGHFMQGQLDVRNPYPGQFPPYFQQRYPGMQRFMRPEQIMPLRQPVSPASDPMKLPVNIQQSKSPVSDAMQDVKPNISSFSVTSESQSNIPSSIAEKEKPDSSAVEIPVSNIKSDVQAAGALVSQISSTGQTALVGRRTTPQPSPVPCGSQRTTPQPVPSPAHSTGSQTHPSPSGNSQRSSPAQSQSPVKSAVPSPHDDLPSVSATFAAAGMMRLGENVPTAPGSFVGQRVPTSNIGLASSGFSSVSSIVQSVSTVSFPALAGQTTTQTGIAAQTPPTEIALPPSTVVKAEDASLPNQGFPASTQTHNQDEAHETSLADPISRAVGVTSTVIKTAVPPSLPSSVGLSNVPGPHGNQTTLPQMQSYQGPPGSAPPHHDHMGGPRMFAPRPGMQSVTSAVQPPGPRVKGSRQPYSHQGHQRFPNMPSNLPPHLAGMLTGMRGPPMPRQPMYPHQQERHPGMPMGPMRFPPGHPMSVAPGGPRAFPIPSSVNTDGVPSTMPSSSGMMMSPTGRHPGMMHHGLHRMMHPAPMRSTAPGGPVGHPMQQIHHGQLSPQISPQISPQMSPNSHPGAPQMHPGIHPPTSGMMGPPGYPQHMGSQPSELTSPTRHPGAPLTPGSVPSTPSPTPSSFSPGMLPPVSSTVPQTSVPAYHGEINTRPQFPYHRMPFAGQRMPYDPRMMYDHSSGQMNPDMHRPPGPIPRFPAELQHQMLQSKLGPSPPGTGIGPPDDGVRPAGIGINRASSVTTSPMQRPGSASVTPPLSGSDTRPSSTSSTPAVKQEPDLGK